MPGSGVMPAPLTPLTPKPSLATTPPKKQKKNGRGKKIVRKTMGVFQCTGDECKKVWKSAHAWTSRKVDCEICGGNAKLVDVKEEECTLDTYNCACGENWQSIHDDKAKMEECEVCHIMAFKEKNTQQRHGAHYWLKCLNKKDCGVEWEDFAPGRVYGQRCDACFNTGELMGVTQAQGGGGRGRGRVPGGGHKAECCDMCMALRAQGIGRSCCNKKEIRFQLTDSGDGHFEEKIVHYS